MEETFSHTRGSVIWLVAVVAIGLVVSVKFHGSSEWLLGVGVGLIFIGGWVGCFRTGRYFSWEAPIKPNKFEGILGWSGAALMVAAFLGLILRVVLDGA